MLCLDITSFRLMEESMIIDLGVDPGNHLNNGHGDEDGSN